MMICFEVMKYQKKCSERRLNVAWISEFVEVKSFVWKMGGKKKCKLYIISWQNDTT